MLQIICLFLRQKISFLDVDKSKTTCKKVIWANLLNFYYIKLCKIIRTNFFMESFNTYYLENLFIDIKNYISQLNCFWVLNNL